MLKNAMPEESTTLHFHGQPQEMTGHMDGAAKISHCPISPGETFTYRQVFQRGQVI